MIRKLAAGIYTWLPLGLKVLRRWSIVRQEMNRAGAQEVLMPAVRPAGTVAGIQPLGPVRPGIAAPQGPPPARLLFRPDARRGSSPT